MTSTTVYVHSGDYDCSEAVRMCYRAVGVLPYGSYMWTGNEIDLLTSNGFVIRDLNSPKRGDVLWRDGHTEMYLGDNIQGGARIDEYGGITGPNKGDQTGNEITKSTYRPATWTYLLRYEGGKTCDGIPASEVAAQVMEHIIDHDSAHGYSQPNRKGDGTIEAIKVTYGTTATKEVKADAKFSYRFAYTMNVRDKPSSTKGNIVTTMEEGTVWDFDGIVIGNGCVWGTYIGPTTKKRLYVAIAPLQYGELA